MIRTSNRYLIALFVLLCVPVQAEEWKNTFHGEAEFDSTQYKDSVPPTNSLLETARVSLDDTLKYGKNFRVKIDPLMQADPLNHSIPERYWIDVPDGYIQAQGEGFTLQVGMNTFTWGATDGYNPLDVVSARRYQEPLRPDKLGAPSVTLKKEFGNITLEGVYIPWQRKSILPGLNSRWLPRQIFSTTSVGNGTEPTLIYLPENVQYHYESDQERDRALYNNVGVRLQMAGILDGLDLSFEGFEGSASTPAVDVGASGSGVFTPSGLIIHANSLVNLTPVYYRQQVAGGSFVYANFGMIFKGEAAVTRVISKGDDLPGHAEAYILGFEKPLPIGANDLTLILQLTYGRHEDPVGNSTTSLERVFDRGIILGAHYNFSEKLGVLASALFDTFSHGELAHIEGTYNLTDAWKIGLGLDGVWGDPATPLGSYNQDDRAVAMVKTSF